MKSNTLELLNARTGVVKFKHAVAMNAVLAGLSFCVYFFLFANWFFLLLPAFCLLNLFISYRAAKRQILK